MFRKILVAVDLADPEIITPALAQAGSLAAAGGGEVRLVNVQSLLPATFMDYVPATFDEEQRAKAEAALKELAATVKLPNGETSCVVRVGGIYPEILGEAKAYGADLVVIGSHRPGMASFLLGSNATSVVRHATCSVLIVRV